MSLDKIEIKDLNHSSTTTGRSSRSEDERMQYYKNLEANITFYKNALSKAEELISKYQVENQSLVRES